MYTFEDFFIFLLLFDKHSRLGVLGAYNFGHLTLETFSGDDFSYLHIVELR